MTAVQPWDENCWKPFFTLVQMYLLQNIHMRVYILFFESLRWISFEFIAVDTWDRFNYVLFTEGEVKKAWWEELNMKLKLKFKIKLKWQIKLKLQIKFKLKMKVNEVQPN